MSSPGPEGDLIDYMYDDQPAEGATIVPAGAVPCNWTAFYCGLLIAAVGGILLSLAPWLAGALILVGYGLAAWTLWSAAKRFGRALCFGFSVSALLGSAILAGDIFFPAVTWSLISSVADHGLLLLPAVLMPWMLGLVRFAYLLIRPSARSGLPGRPSSVVRRA
ncbi:MAG: hypothetical protein WBX25_25150 [Rhodomicrobium sp.]